MRRGRGGTGSGSPGSGQDDERGFPLWALCTPGAMGTKRRESSRGQLRTGRGRRAGDGGEGRGEEPTVGMRGGGLSGKDGFLSEGGAVT